MSECNTRYVLRSRSLSTSIQGEHVRNDFGKLFAYDWVNRSTSIGDVL